MNTKKLLVSNEFCKYGCIEACHDDIYKKLEKLADDLKIIKEKLNLKTQVHLDYDDYLNEQLEDIEFALAYLIEASKDDDPRVLLLAMKRVKDARELSECRDTDKT